MDPHYDKRHDPPRPEPDPDYKHDLRRQAQLDNEDQYLAEIRRLSIIAKAAVEEARDLITRLHGSSAEAAKQLLSEVTHG